MRWRHCLGAGLWLWLAMAAAAAEGVRTWTSDDGRKIEATLVGADDGGVTLKLASGSTSIVPWARLSQEDQAHARKWREENAPAPPLPEVVEPPPESLQIELVEERPEDRHFLYRTKNFEFDSQGKLAPSLMKEVARNFEATYELLKALPWEIRPAPPDGDFFRASLYISRDEYLKAGGLPNSGGVYMSGRKRFLVPFESIGLREVGKAYRKDDDFSTGAVVHELTHQMMHFWLPFLPQWVVEGTAEYCGNLPLQHGKFRLSSAKGGLRDYVKFLRQRTVQGVPEPYPLDQLFAVTPEEWNSQFSSNPAGAHRLYFTSYLMVYFFMHLDGEGDGRRFIRFMRRVGELKDKAEDYRKAMEEFRRHPEVEQRPDGTLVFPSTLKPPEMPRELVFEKSRQEAMRENLKILLDGRTEQELFKEVRSAFQRLGIRL